jgi:hypothetical protein
MQNPSRSSFVEFVYNGEYWSIYNVNNMITEGFVSVSVTPNSERPLPRTLTFI